MINDAQFCLKIIILEAIYMFIPCSTFPLTSGKFWYREIPFNFCVLPCKVGGSGYPDPKKGRISEIFGSDIGSGSGYPKFSVRILELGKNGRTLVRWS